MAALAKLLVMVAPETALKFRIFLELICVFISKSAP
jgi:hypothetical protein